MKYRILQFPEGKYSVEFRSSWGRTWYAYRNQKGGRDFYNSMEDAEKEIHIRNQKPRVMKEFEL